MPIRIFYAWQSDRDRVICRDLIENATNEAINQLKDGQLTLEPAPSVGEQPGDLDIQLDHSTMGIEGWPKVADEIQQKIADCDIFLADLTVVSQYTTTDGQKREKRIPNGNVLIELGQAMIQKGPKRIIPVMNTAFGGFRFLPFDLHLHRAGIGYNLLDAKDSKAVVAATKKLTADLVMAIGAIVSRINEKDRAAKAEQTRQQLDQAVIQGRQAADEAWTSFLNRARSGLHGLSIIRTSTAHRHADAVLAAALIPLLPPPQKLTLKEVKRIRYIDLRTLGGSNRLVELRDNVIVAKTDTDEEMSKFDGVGVMEMNVRGTLFAIEKLAVHNTSNVGNVYLFDGDEEAMFNALSGYIRIVRASGVTGPLYVRVLLAGVHNAMLKPRNASKASRSGIRPIQKYEIMTDPVILGAEVDGHDVSAVAEAMCIETESIWNASGVDDDPCFTKDRKYIHAPAV